MRGDAVQSLYALLERIYVPLLRQGDGGKSKGGKEKAGKVNAQVRDLLYSLRSGLRRTVLRGGFGDLRGWSPDKFTGILEPSDEIDIWQEVADDRDVAEIDKYRQTADIVSKHFAKVHIHFDDLAS